VTLRDAVTYLMKYDIDTGSVVYDGIGYRNAFNQSPGSASAAPRWRSVAGADLSYGGHDLSVTWRYTSGVVDDYGLNLGAVATDRIKAFSVFDIQYTKSFGTDDRFSFTAGMINALDTAPGFAKFNGYLPSIADPFGRQMYVRVGAKF